MLSLKLKVFTDKRTIYIVRNGVDVAHSLHALEDLVIARHRASAARAVSRFRYRTDLVRFGFKGEVCCLYLNGGFSLWEEYAPQFAQFLASLDNQ